MRPDLTALRRGAALSGVLAVLALAAPAGAQTATQDDLRALVFYLEQNDQRAVEAEMRRLRAQFPDWRPPGDLSELTRPQAGGGGAAGPDVAGIWRRIERNDFSGARQAIDQTRRNFPDWSPDPDLLRVLELNEAQAAFDSAVSARDAPRAISVAQRSPRLLRCDRINNAWQLADMFQLAGQTGSAVATHRSTLQSCTRFSDMQSTLEKADAIASSSQMSELFAAARAAAPANEARLNELEARLRAGRGGAAPAASAGTSAPPASPSPRAPSQAQAPSPTPQPQAAPAAASQVAGAAALRRLPPRGDGRAAKVRAAKEAAAWSRCLARSASPRSLEVLYERSWCALAHDRPAEALSGFAAVDERAGALGGSVPRDVRFGLALAYLSLQMTEEGARIAGSVNLTNEQRREVETIVLDQRGVRAYRLGEYRQAIAHFNALEQVNGSLRRDLAILRAYAYLNSNQRSTAREQFERLHAQLATSETRAGLNAAR